MVESPPLTVSVVIPHYNDFDHLARCVESLRRQTLPRQQFEVIVADNNSVGGVAAVGVAPGIGRGGIRPGWHVFLGESVPTCSAPGQGLLLSV